MSEPTGAIPDPNEDPARTLPPGAGTVPNPLPVDTSGLAKTILDIEAAGGVSPPRTLSIPGYEILQELGRGGMGIVYKARQQGLDRLVALKLVLDGSYAKPEDLSRFRNEAKAIAQLQHPHIVQIYHPGEHEGRPYFVFEFVEGGNLAQAMRAGRWEPQRAAALVEKLARATHAVHGKGIIHRDLKPANVLLDRAGEPRITDFGLARQMGGSTTAQTASNAVMGTPSYMAPEQAGGRKQEIGPQTDVYALGAILYELLTGRPPFEGDTPVNTILQVISDEPVPPRKLTESIPPELETICVKCLAKRPADRYVSALALADDLRRFCEGDPILARPPGLWRRMSKWREKHPGTAVACFFAGCMLLLGAAWTMLTLNFLAMPLFAVVMYTFLRPGKRSIAICAASIVAAGAIHALISYAVHDNPYGLTVALALSGLVPAVVVGSVGRIVAWIMHRDAFATALGAFFGFVIGSPCFCFGMIVLYDPRLLATSFQNSTEDVNGFEPSVELGLRVVSGIVAVFAALVPTAVGAVAAAVGSGRRALR